MDFKGTRILSKGVSKVLHSRVSRRFIPFYSFCYGVDVSAAEKNTKEYTSLSDFFCRKLKPGERSVDENEALVVSPVDGRVDAYGTIKDGQLVQAKGIAYTLEALTGDEKKAEAFKGGEFVTLYLSPKDYHRIHAPAGGTIEGFSYIPGTLFPVNRLGRKLVNGLFTKNERLITYMNASRGSIAVVKVGAFIVGSTNASYDAVQVDGKRIEKVYSQPIEVEKGGELGWFEFGSTVVLLFQKGTFRMNPEMKEGDFVRMGVPIGKWTEENT